jgi:PAS domain S-box-containing protein
MPRDLEPPFAAAPSEEPAGAGQPIPHRGRYRTLVEQLPVATYVMDADGNVTYVSPQIEQILGHTAAEFARSARTHADRTPWFHPDDVVRTLGQARDVYEGRADGYDFSARMFHADGSIRHVRAIARALKDERGRLQAVQGVMLDITEEVTARARLQASEHRYQALVEQTPVTTVLTDLSGRVIYASPQVERLTGFPATEFVAAPPAKAARPLFHPDDVALVWGRLELLFAGDLEEVEVAARAGTARDGVREVHVIARPLRAAGGAVSGAQAVVVDMTDLRRAERRTREVIAALVNAAETERARISVELHDDTVQVLAAMLMRVRMLAPGNPGLEGFEEMLAGALERTRKLMFELRPQLLEHEGLGSALRALAQDGPWAEADVAVDVPRQSVEVEAIVYRAIRELIINARKHSRADRLELTGGQVDGTLVFTVADDGVGFDPEAALSRTGRVMHLGLDATIERVRLAGGELSIDAGPGRGSRFRVSLPAEPLR